MRPDGKIARDAGAYRWREIAHNCGLVAVGIHPSPVPNAVSAPILPKRLAGKRGGCSCAKKKYAKRGRLATFLESRGGP